MKALIADRLPQEKVDTIRELKWTVFYKPELQDQSLDREMRKQQPEVLIVRGTPVTETMICRCPELRVIVRAGSGYNTIDVEAATKHGVAVANCPGKNSIAVAELVFGLILSLDRQIVAKVTELGHGRWNRTTCSQAKGLFGRTLGIVGLGRIGREIVPRAKGFGLNIVAWSRSLTVGQARDLDIDYASTPLEVAPQADIVTVHLSISAETHQLIGEEFFRAMKPGAYFINTSRAEIVDPEALGRAIDEKGILAGLDVFFDEPSEDETHFRVDLLRHLTVYGTPHIGACTNQAELAVADEAIRILSEYRQSGRVLNCVNEQSE
jgi:D-3-phosphoglycerate dehydrogenase